MRLKPEQLTDHLKQGLQPVYLVSGNEPLLAQEATDEIRAALQADGYNERELFDSEKVPWDQFAAESNSMSLFGDRRILEVRTPAGKVGDPGSAALQEFASNPPADTVLLMVTSKLDKRALSKPWVKAIEEAGVHVQVWPVAPHQLQRWLGQRLSRAGVEADSHAIEILADRVEGNLLAAKQEIEKLALITDGERIDARAMSSLIADSARYDVFTLLDRAMDGNAETACRTLRGLKEEGVQPLHILAILLREIRMLISMQTQLDNGIPMPEVLRKAYVWKNREPLVRKTLNRCSMVQLRVLLRQARGVDQAVKGVRKVDPWLELTDLILNLSGQPALKPASLKLMLA